MAERIADVRRKLHEALDALARSDEVVARLRADLEASGRRLAEEAARRRAAEARLAQAEARLAEGPAGSHGELGGRAAAGALVRHAGADLAGAAGLAVRAVWHRLPEPVRARIWAVRQRLGRG